MALLSLLAKLGLDATGFNQGLKQAESSANRFGTSVAASLKSRFAGAFSVGSAIAIGRTIVQTASRAQDLAEQFDITTDAVQRIDFALKQGGLSFEDFGTAMDKFGAIRKKAAQGDEESAATLRQFGITLDEIQNPLATNLELIEKMVIALRGVKISPAQRADLREIFGRSSGRMLSALQGMNGDAPFQASQGDIKTVEGFGDAISAAVQAAKNAGVRIAADLIKNPWKLLTQGGLISSAGSLWNPSGGGDTYSAADLAAMRPSGGDTYSPDDLAAMRGSPAAAAAAAAGRQSSPSGFSVAADSLANVGGFVGGAGTSGGSPISVLQQSLRVQMTAKDYLREIAENKAIF